MKRVYHVRDDLRRKLPRTPQFEFSDKKKHYILMTARSEGGMGYWEKNAPNQVYSLKIDSGTHKITCRFERREDGKRQHDWLVSLLTGILFAAAVFFLFYFAFKMTAVGSAVWGIISGGLLFGMCQLLYRRERKAYIAMLDNYIRTFYGAVPKGKE